jgi:hypothetical protein
VDYSKNEAESVIVRMADSILKKRKPTIDKFFPEVIEGKNAAELKTSLTRTLILVATLFNKDTHIPTTELEYRVAKKLAHLGDVTYFLTKAVYEYAKKNNRGGEYNWANIAHILGILDAVQHRFAAHDTTQDVLDDIIGCVSQSKLEVYCY